MIEVAFATNRDWQGPDTNPHFGDRFHPDGPAFYRVGIAEVERVSEDPDEGYQVRRVHLAAEGAGGDPQALGSAEIFAALQRRMRIERRDALVLLHGFANSVESAIARAAQLAETYLIGRPDGSLQEPIPFAFCWPSNGRVTPPWQYFSDRHDAEASGLAMARALLRLRDFLISTQTCGQHLHLVAHSMGGYALRHAVQGLRRQLGSDELPCLFDDALLIAADEDDDALETVDKLGLLPRLARLVHVYHSADDRALAISDLTKLNPDRLGTHGPRTFSGLSTRISAVDCELVGQDRALGDGHHQYYRLRPEVIRDIRAVLTGVARPDRLPWRETIEPGRRYRIRALAAGAAAAAK